LNFSIAKGRGFCYTMTIVKEQSDCLPLQSSTELISRQIRILQIVRITTPPGSSVSSSLCIMVCLFFCPYGSAPWQFNQRQFVLHTTMRGWDRIEFPSSRPRMLIREGRGNATIPTKSLSGGNFFMKKQFVLKSITFY